MMNYYCTSCGLVGYRTGDTDFPCPDCGSDDMCSEDALSVQLLLHHIAPKFPESLRNKLAIHDLRPMAYALAPHLRIQSAIADGLFEQGSQ